MMLKRPIKAILFDFYQTIVEVKTDETKDRLWEVLAMFLEYRGADVGPDELREVYHQEVQEGLANSRERYPEIDVTRVFRALLEHLGVGSAPALAGPIAQLFRVLSMERFQLYPESRDVLWKLAERYGLALVSDSQRVYLEPELRRTGLGCYFQAAVSSSVLGFRKPDPRMFEKALARLKLAKDEVVHVGDSWERDMEGARDAGIQGIWLCRRGDRLVGPRPLAVPVIADLRELLPLLGHVADRL